MSLREEFEKRRMDYVKNYSEANNLDAYSVIWYADEVISHQEVIISQERQAKEELLEALKKSNQYLIEDQKLGIMIDRLNQPQIDNNIILIDKHTEKDKER